MADFVALDVSADFSDFSMELENPQLHTSFALYDDDQNRQLHTSFALSNDNQCLSSGPSGQKLLLAPRIEETDATLSAVCGTGTDAYGSDEGEPTVIMVMGISFMARLIDAIIGEDITGVRVSETLGMNADVYFENFRGGYFASIEQYAMDNVRECSPEIVLLEVGSNDLCWVEHDPIRLAQSIRDLMGLIRCAHSVKAVVALQVLQRTKVCAGMRDGGFQDPLGVYNERVKTFNDEMERLSCPDKGILFWRFEYKVGGIKGMAICPRDGVHVREDRIIHYYHEVRGALLKARRVCWGQEVSRGKVWKPRTKKRGPGTAKKARKAAEARRRKQQATEMEGTA